MELQGRIKQLLPIEQGVSQRTGRVWKKQTYILQTSGNYPKNVAFDLFNDNITTYNLKAGDDITASIDIESREFNGRWYTSVTAFKVVKTDNATAVLQTPQSDPLPAATAPTPIQDLQQKQSEENDGDMPF